MRRFRVPLLWAAAMLTFGNGMFTAAAGLAWPRHLPMWATRVNSAVFLVTVVVAGLAALGFWQESRRQP